MIKDVIVKKLTKHCDDRGFLLEVLREDENILVKFGQTTYTVTYPGVIKAFHWHRKQDDLWFVASGMARVVLYDLREDSVTYRQTQQIFAGQDNPVLIVIPQGVAHGYQVLGERPVALLYHTTRAYNPDEPDEERISFDDPAINFDWSVKNR